MIDRRISAAMVAHAETLLAHSAHWSRGTAQTTDGRTVNVVAFASSRHGVAGKTVVYLTRCDGEACSCKGFQVRQACSHAVACKMDAERAREAAARKPASKLDALMDRWLDEGTRTVQAF